MLQILIADDEKKIRQGLRNIVDWEALGYQIAGEAANGEEAVSFLAARRPDVVLLDISMPKCNGLEVVRRAQEQGFSGKVIILSGYSDFKYAQEAIRLGVKFYLTKPIDEKELEQLLLQLKEEIAEESKKRAAATNYYQRARETILRDLFLKPGNVALLDLVDMNTAAVEYQVVLYERYVSQQKDMGFSFERFLRVNNQENHLFDLIELEQAQGVLLKGEGVIRRFHELLEQCAEQAANSLPTALDHVFLAYGRKVSTLGEIHLSYEDAHLLLSRKFFTEQKQHVVGYSEAGMAYNSGGPTVRVLDIWKKAAPSIDLLCPDIYMPCRDYYTHFCQAYSREDNALFIPESGFAGPSAALNVIRAAAQYEAVGVCCFGAESALDETGSLREDVVDTAVSFQMVRNVAPLLLQYHGTGRIHAILQEEFMDQQLILTEGFRIVAHFDIRRRIPDTRETLPRGRGILVQTGEYEFYLTGDNVALDFVARPDPEEEMPRFWLACRQFNQLNFLTVEEGHFDEQNQWVVDFRRNGDETNYETYARKGEVVRIRLNPKMGKKGFVKA